MSVRTHTPPAGGDCKGQADVFDQAAAALATAGRPSRTENPDVARALAICRGCPIQTECLEWALTTDDNWQILGGTTPRQRNGNRRR